MWCRLFAYGPATIPKPIPYVLHRYHPEWFYHSGAVPAYAGCRGKMPLNRCCCCMAIDTSRLPLSSEEQNEGNYVFVTYETMLADIAMHAYLEYGSYDGALYGTKLDTIRQIHSDSLIAVIDVEPQVNKTSLPSTSV